MDMRKLLIGVILAALAACGDTTSPDGSHPGANRLVITQDIDRFANDAVTINSATINGNSLELSVSYGGGCRDHEFGLITNGVFAESYPVQTWVKLTHEANGDNCFAMLSRTLRFDLSPLKALYNSAYKTRSGIMVIHVTDGISVTYSW